MRNAETIQSLAGYASDAFTLTGNGEPKTIFSAMVTTNFFSTVGVTPMLGRDFGAGEGTCRKDPAPRSPSLAITSEKRLRRRFENHRGRVVDVSIGKPVTIVGVLPRDFELAPAGIVSIGCRCTSVPTWLRLAMRVG